MEQQLQQISPALSIEQETLYKQKPSYFTRLFSGRMNRQNYIIGSTFFVLIPLICFLIVIFNILLSPSIFAMPSVDLSNPTEIVLPQVSLVALLETPVNEMWSTIGIVFFILSLPYLLSLQIKRLHDLNLNGWIWILNIVPLFFLKQLLSFTELTHPDILFFVGNVASFIVAVFSLYVTLWPGTKGINKYGEQPLSRSNFTTDIMQIK